MEMRSPTPLKLLDPDPREMAVFALHTPFPLVYVRLPALRVCGPVTVIGERHKENMRRRVSLLVDGRQAPDKAAPTLPTLAANLLPPTTTDLLTLVPGNVLEFRGTTIHRSPHPVALLGDRESTMPRL